jgi:hypothetical protein
MSQVELARVRRIRMILVATISVLLSSMLLASPAWSAECDVLLAEVDAALASVPPEISEELLAEAEALREIGAADCAAGNDTEAVAELSQAKFKLGGYAPE